MRSIYEFKPRSNGVLGLEPVYCTQYAGNMSQYNPAIHLLEQHVERTQQGIPTLIYNQHPPVDPQLSSYQEQVEYPLGPFNLDTATAAPPQPTRGHPPVYYSQGGQSQGIPIIAEIPASHSPASSRASGSPSSPVLPVSQVLGLTPHRQPDSGPRRILAIPIDSLSITDPTIHEIVAGFLVASWRLNQIEEPAYVGKSCYFQLIDESTMMCRLCGKQERRAERLVSHLRGHFDHRPYSCGGQCGNKEWYASYFWCTASVDQRLYSGQRFTERRGVKDHAERPTVQCPKW